jgi:CxxC motif-containing protein (DUF1111 family)
MLRRIAVRRTAKRLFLLFCSAIGVLAYRETRDYRTAPRADAATIELGRELFTHRWSPNDPLAGGDGLGPVFNAESCAACHSQPGLGGSSPADNNVTQFTVRKLVKVTREVTVPCAPVQRIDVKVPTAASLHQGVVHRRATAPEFQEARDVFGLVFQHDPDRQLELSARNPISLFGVGLIDQIPDSAILEHARGGGIAAAMFGLASGLRQQAEGPLANNDAIFQEDHIHGRAYRLADGRIGRFGWRADFATLKEFSDAACATELGLGNPGHEQATPLVRADYKPPGLDLTRQHCEAIAAFLRELPRPVEEVPSDPADRSQAGHGKSLFTAIGCAKCHVPDLGPAEGLYSDLLLHDMADPKTGPYGVSLRPEVDPSELKRPSEGEWRTPPLWGVADSAPYMHDGSAYSLEEAIRAHRGTSRPAATRFSKLSDQDRAALLAFLNTLRAPADARRPALAQANSRSLTVLSGRTSPLAAEATDEQ